MGCGSIPVWGSLWLNNALMVLKTEIDDDAPAGRKKALFQSFSKDYLKQVEHLNVHSMPQ